MAATAISGLTALTAPAVADELIVVDDSAGDNKSLALGYLARASDGQGPNVTGGGTLALAGFTLTVPATGTAALTGLTLAQFAATTSAQLAGIISDETGTGSLVFAASPTLTTPTFSGTITHSSASSALYNQTANAGSVQNVYTSYGSVNPIFLSLRAKGTLASPTAVVANDYLFIVSARGYDGTNFSGGNDTASLTFVAAENFSPTNRGTQINISSTAVGSAAAVTAVTILGANVGLRGNLTMVETTAPSAPAANGCIIYAQDNGAGKTRLMALFSSGAAQQVAIQP